MEDTERQQIFSALRQMLDESGLQWIVNQVDEEMEIRAAGEVDDSFAQRDAALDRVPSELLMREVDIAERLEGLLNGIRIGLSDLAALEEAVQESIAQQDALGPNTTIAFARDVEGGEAFGLGFPRGKTEDDLRSILSDLEELLERVGK